MIVREFWVVEGQQRDFERVFRADGTWAEMLRQSEDYLGTAFRLETEVQARYLIFDYWRSHWSFEVFRSKHQQELKDFSQLVLGQDLVRREVFRGSFYEDDPGSEEGTDVVA